MGRMNQSTFKTLFEYGKKVYQGELDLGTAATNANAQNPEVAVSSARHYITWYSKMKTGEFLTWNTNSDLLLYYVKRITEEDGADAGDGGSFRPCCPAWKATTTYSGLRRGKNRVK